MEAENFISLPACSGSEFETENSDPHESVREESNVLPHHGEPEAIEDGAINEDLENNANVGSEGTQLLPATDNDVDMCKNNSGFEDSVEMTDEFEVTEELTVFNSKTSTDNGFVTVKEESREDQNLGGRSEIDLNALSSAKRPRTSLDEEQPSVHVTYNALTRESKQKLEELLQQWSQWHAEHCSSLNDSKQVFESGEATYFPALHVGLEKSSAVSFWMDDLPRNKRAKEYTPFDDKYVPLYDRKYTIALTSPDGSSNKEGVLLEVVDASRCFNCGSYSHSLKDCPKPRDAAAVNNARKQHRSKKIQNASSRNPTRYYQSSAKGKYDGLRPGVLHPETRRLLGLGELDPPPWLHRMREIGYPPGYLDPDDEDMPSGITIFGEEVIQEETEEGEILEKGSLEPPKKMSVEFPGINAPIPEDADKWLWASSNWKSSGTHSHSRHHIDTSDNTRRGHFLGRQLSREFEDDRHSHRPKAIDRGHYHDQSPRDRGHYHDQARRDRGHYHDQSPRDRGHHHEHPPRDFDDEGPPGCGRDPVMSPSLSHRLGGYDPNLSAPSPRDGPSGSRSHSFGRSSSDRGRTSPLGNEGSSLHSSYPR